MTDFHVHTNFCDGNGAPEEYVRSALAKGMERIGFSGHGYIPFDETYCMPKHAEAYRAEIARLKEAYKGQIDIYCGVEMDSFSDEDTSLYDYVIGSVHYVTVDGKHYTVDHTEEIQKNIIREVFGGDAYAFAENYFQNVGEVVERTNCDFIGHFDLLTKFNETGNIFDETHPRYIAAWQSAAEKLLKTGKPFEINMGAISRGYRKTPYPAIPITTWLAERGAKFVLSSDAHSPENICYAFDKWREVYEKIAPIESFCPKR
ncbi:MAG: histidinol-phosphatase [Oscillospiraceae bacterium]|nr:histidinol-phosphatase [Oscillospiraceae bacterium]